MGGSIAAGVSLEKTMNIDEGNGFNFLFTQIETMKVTGRTYRSSDCMLGTPPDVLGVETGD